MPIHDPGLATPSHVRLCPVDGIAEGAARNFVLEMRAGRFHGFVVRRGDGLARRGWRRWLDVDDPNAVG